MKTRTMPAGKCKARRLAVMDEVQKKRQTVVITKRGKPGAKLIPIDDGLDGFFGRWKGKIKIHGDTVGPALTLEEWGDLA
jgi:prevent-host-death family protein